MKNKIIIVVSAILVLVTTVFIILGISRTSDDKIGYIPGNGGVLANVVLVYQLDVELDSIGSYDDRDWLTHNEPEYMTQVLECCALIMESYFNNEIPCDFDYSNSSEYSYNDGSGGSVCLLTPNSDIEKEYIVEIADTAIYLYEINTTE